MAGHELIGERTTRDRAVSRGASRNRHGVEPGHDWYRDADHDGVDCAR